MSLHCIADREKEAPMSRTRVSCRPHLEVLEDRSVPGSLLGGTDPDPDLAILAGIYAAPREAAIQTTSPVVLFNDHSVVVGESTLIRTDNGVIAHLTASGLAPGAYTFWMKVNAPDGSVVSGRLAGHVVGQDGILNFSAHVSAGEVLGAGSDVNPDFPSGPLQDPLHSKITLVVRAHGPAEPGHIYEQTHTNQPGVAMNFLISIHAPPP
jgi:hypothetical protein